MRKIPIQVHALGCARNNGGALSLNRRIASGALPGVNEAGRQNRVETAIEVSRKVKFDTLIHLTTVLREGWGIGGAFHDPIYFADAIQSKS
jgi:hypothetical protein